MSRTDVLGHANCSGEVVPLYPDLSPRKFDLEFPGKEMDKIWRVLVADDEQDMRDYFRKILPRLGYQVVGVAENGQELVDLFRTLQPDFIITDICMPLVNGLEAVRSIFQEQVVPVILVSARGEPLPDRAEFDHLVCHIGKPVKRENLIQTIASVLQKFEESKKMTEKVDKPSDSTTPPSSQSPPIS